MRKKYPWFGDVCEEVNQDLQVKRNVGLGVKMSPMNGTNKPWCLMNNNDDGVFHLLFRRNEIQE